jgi:hypothetical protein
LVYQLAAESEKREKRGRRESESRRERERGSRKEGARDRGRRAEREKWREEGQTGKSTEFWPGNGDSTERDSQKRKLRAGCIPVSLVMYDRSLCNFP